jgi:hypothetical protein
MKNLLLIILFFTFLIVSFPCRIIAQQQPVDTGYIHSFERNNVIEVFPGLYTASFKFTRPGEKKNNFRLLANSSGYAGAYLNYKWLSLNYSFAIPGTYRDRNVKLKYTSLGFRFGGKQYSLHPFFDAYNGLLIPEEKHRDSFKIFRGIQFTDAGFDIYFFTNTKKHSFSAAQSFAELQRKNAGAYFFMITPLWQKINWNTPSRTLISDSTTYVLLSSVPQWISLIARVGYTYTFTFQQGKWSVAPAFLLGGGGLKEMNAGNHHLQGISDIQGWLNAGYNGPQYYFYVNASWDNLNSNLFIKNMHQKNMDISMTIGFRFPDLKKKLLGII